ncbi:Uncharacterised protein [Bordetella pertussis]|nr:Uncharacterised protein [Bordetella pertussis]CFW03374.1 Uncharacterised protein [Bordetella pertussis]CPJ05923.1 Uncharacterised protein [Bordetella pertussis]CPJ45298.1 Uncharacterised protein [Bordetella pertussis]CPK22452.1 Uncharacterised protein [Bordetella pertussis]
MGGKACAVEIASALTLPASSIGRLAPSPAKVKSTSPVDSATSAGAAPL